MNFDSDYFGPGDGLVTFDTLGLCGGSVIGQTYDLLTASHSEPLVFSIEYFGSASDACFSPVALVFNGVPQPIAMPDQNGVARVCLGERAYGSGIELELRAMSTPACPETIYCHPRSFGGISIRSARPGECGAIGGFANADFSDQLQGWRFHSEPNPRVNEDGALVLEHHMCRGETSAQSNVSIPLPTTLANPAIRFDVRFDPGPEPQLIGRRPAVTIGFDPSEGQFARQVEAPMSETTTVTTCVPSFAQGTSQTIYFMGFDPLSGCRVNDPVLLYTMSLANLEVVSDPGCAVLTPELAIDSIEGTKSPWHFDTMHAGQSNSNDSAVDFVTDAQRARSGSQVLKLEARTGCTVATARTHAVVPRPVAGLRPALRFWHRIDTTDDKYLARTNPFGGIDRTLYPGPDWQREEYCIDETHHGHLMPMMWDLMSTAGSCDPLPSAVTLWIDDVEMALSDTCP